MKYMVSIIILTLVVFTCCAGISRTQAADPPKVYLVKVSQDSGAPYVIYGGELENTLGDISWRRLEEGRFRMDCFECFPDETKVAGLREFHFMDNGGKYRIFWDDETEPSGSSLILETYNSSGVLSDNQLSSTEVKILVYEPDV